jgi:hypothetical protein
LAIDIEISRSKTILATNPVLGFFFLVVQPDTGQRINRTAIAQQRRTAVRAKTSTQRNASRAPTGIINFDSSGFHVQLHQDMGKAFLFLPRPTFSFFPFFFISFTFPPTAYRLIGSNDI